MNLFLKPLFMVVAMAISASIFSSFTVGTDNSIANHISPDDGDPIPILLVKVRKSDNSVLDADIKLSQGVNEVNHSTIGGELTVSAFNTGMHDIEITKTGYQTLNSSFDAQGESMTLIYTLIEE